MDAVAKEKELYNRLCTLKITKKGGPGTWYDFYDRIIYERGMEWTFDCRDDKAIDKLIKLIE